MATRPNVHYVIKRDESIERALRRFKRQCEHAGISKLVRSKRYYEKPSDMRRRELRKRLRNRRRAERKAQERMQRKLDRARKQQRSKRMRSNHPAPGVTAPADAPQAASTPVEQKS